MPTPTTEPAPGARRTRIRRAVRRTVLARRRTLAAACAALAVVASVAAARPPAPATVAVVVAARDLPSGTVLRSGDLVVRSYPAGAAPVGSDPRAVGRTLAGPVRRGEPVTDVRLVGPALMAGYPGRVAVPVRISDPAAAALLRVGDRVDLVAADPRRGSARYLAVDLPVAALPAPTSPVDGAGGPTGRLVVVAALPSDVVTIVGASVTDLLSAVFSR